MACKCQDLKATEGPAGGMQTRGLRGVAGGWGGGGEVHTQALTDNASTDNTDSRFSPVRSTPVRNLCSQFCVQQ